MSSACICVIVVNYRNTRLVHNFIKSMHGMSHSERVRTLVVDNASDNDTKSALAPLKSPDVQILHQECNLGYFGGAQAGLEWIRAEGMEPDWIIVSNSDISFPQPDLWRLLANYPVDQTVGILAPEVLSSRTLRDQNPFHRKRPSALRMHFYKWVYKTYLTGALYRLLATMQSRLQHMRMKSCTSQSTEPRRPFQIYAPHGSFIIFHRNYFARGLDFSHHSFLYNEEFTIAERCRAHGLKVIYDPGLKVRHLTKGTKEGISKRDLLRFHSDAGRNTADQFFKLTAPFCSRF